MSGTSRWQRHWILRINEAQVGFILGFQAVMSGLPEAQLFICCGEAAGFLQHFDFWDINMVHNP